MEIRIQPSILSADFVNFQKDFESISAADGIHVDVMDGHFVPNLTFGLPMVKRMQEISKLPLDVHLMIENPDYWAPKYAELELFSVTVHFEALRDATATARAIKAAGSRAGLAIKPKTELSAISDIVHEFDQLLIMSVEPGFGGQSFIQSSIGKAREAIALLREINSSIWLQMDGGIDETNIAALAQVGVDTFVAGSAVFKEIDRNARINLLRSLAEGASKN
ncbi:MAG: ribulose-phosphate 3-epimerase [Rhodoluna sp.]